MQYNIDNRTSAPRWLCLIAILCAAAFPAAAQDLKIGGAGPLIGTMELLAEAYNKSRQGRRVEVVPRDKNNNALSMGSSGGVRNGLEGQYRGMPFLGFSSEALKGELRKTGQSIEVARVALVFVVPASSPPIDNISTQQVIDIYSRKMQEWRPGESIYLVRRPLNESDNNILMEKIPELRKFIPALVDPNNDLGKGLPKVANDAQESATWIAEHRGAFGTSSMNLIITEKRALKALKFNGVEPTPANVRDYSYPLQKGVFIITGKTVTPEMSDFIDFVSNSEASRDIFTRTGHVFTAGSGAR